MTMALVVGEVANIDPTGCPSIGSFAMTLIVRESPFVCVAVTVPKFRVTVPSAMLPVSVIDTSIVLIS
eukprot:CAMPEP_0194051696 /NCGR_PEP_ID=MMETSP0009_2-20130614/41823_1 /TAXON_ID=210454 /ORGANISM="Grammatophora oceanica, Strain CCMP 410" /LENGTH=67 /DNA_ID=CAMNT_0038698919 /DNA_START=18 /DNA_END=218 /DNA_ORIENTATION=-